MTDSFFDVVLWPTFIGGAVLGAIMVVVYIGLAIVNFVMAKTIEHDINWKNISGYFVIVCIALAISWFIGSRLMRIYYE